MVATASRLITHAATIHGIVNNLYRWTTAVQGRQVRPSGEILWPKVVMNMRTFLIGVKVRNE